MKFSTYEVKREVYIIHSTYEVEWGHNDPKTTMIYSHLKKADAKSAVEGLEF